MPRLSSRLPFVAALLLAAVTVSQPAASGDPPSADLVYEAVDVAGASGHLLTIDLKTASLRVLDSRIWGKTAMTAEEFAARSGAAAVLNGPFFDVDGSPMGLLVVDGKIKQALRRADWGVFYLDPTGAHIVHTSEYSASKAVSQAFQVGPRLVVGGEVLGLKPQSARRTAMCVRAGGDVLALVTGNAVEAADLARWLADQGCVDALNLDGGPSSQLWVRSGEVAVDVPGGTGFPIGVGVFPGQPAARQTRSGGCGG